LVSNEASNDISLIDGATDVVLRSLPVGKRPRGLKVSPDGSKVYVALSGTPRGGPNVDESTLPPPDRSADGIGVVDIASLTPNAQGDMALEPKAGVVQQVGALQPSILHGKLESGDDPETIDSTPDGRILAVANEDSAKLRLMDAQTGAAAGQHWRRARAGGAALSTRRQGGVRHERGHRSSGCDRRGERRVIATVPVGKRPRSILFSPDGDRAYITCELASRIDVIDSRAHRTLTSIEIEGTPKAMPMGMALDPSEQRLYVSLGRAGEVAVIDVRSLRLLTRIADVGARPWGIALSPDGDKVYTANGPSGDVSVIDTRSMTVIHRIPVGKMPWGLGLVRVRGG
jgi:YVTN family beta-propeller protein